MKKNGFPVKHLSAFSKFIGKVTAGSGKLLPVILAALSLTACMTAANPASDQTSLPQASEVPAQTETPTPEATLTPTNTSTPTATEIPPLALAEFSAELKGKGVHGGMVCYSYAGDAKDLEGLTLLVDISRDGKAIEKNISPEQIDGENCFEITDASYLSVSPNAEGGRLLIPEEPLSVKITAAQEGRVLSNNAQTIDLGKYVQFPFLQWIYPEEAELGCISNMHSREDPNTKEKIPYPAWDFIPKPSNEYPTIVGTPVLAPVSGVFYFNSVPSEDETNPVQVNAIMIFSSDTGFLINPTHQYELVKLNEMWIPLNEFVGKEVIAGEQIGIIGPKDWASTIPHTHLQILIPPYPVDLTKEPDKLGDDLYRYLTDIAFPNIDFLKERLFLDEALNDRLNSMPNVAKVPSADVCQSYPWGEVVIPQQLPFTIDGKADDWAEYTPVLTDKTGDSKTGSVMDLSELYMAKDDNYLYLMLKAGDKPSGKWVVDFHADLFRENSCGNTERWIQIPSLYPNKFYLMGETSCDFNYGEKNTAEYVWGNVLEVRIPLPYLRNPSELEPKELNAYIQDLQGGYSIPDTMR